jgi:membrane protein YqaA with SNARE-associated domain
MAFEAIIAIFIKYGLTGLLASSFISSLVFIPGYASFLIPLYVRFHFNPWRILVVITIGSIGGEIVNYYLGYVGSKYVFHKEIKKAEKWLNKWGEMSVFIVNLIPVFPADFVNVLVGFFRMDFKMYVIGMGLGKAIQYALLIFGIEIFFKYMSLL